MRILMTVLVILVSVDVVHTDDMPMMLALTGLRLSLTSLNRVMGDENMYGVVGAISTGATTTTGSDLLQGPSGQQEREYTPALGKVDAKLVLAAGESHQH
ncbi:hypothetical protein RJT34_12966 [Clitoria ternatea]|uniref:Secreted protein n=1 Tax=Clitoria ternatea TaxID=43366 RepID=A0AAN9PLW7_CLITE